MDRVPALSILLRRAGCAVGLLVLLIAALPSKADEPGEEAALAATTSEEPARSLEPAWDPAETVNRVSFGLNRGIDFIVVRPFALIWSLLKPVYVPQAIDNIYKNIAIVRNVLANMLQGQPGRATVEGQRFLINTTIGLVGIWDPASHWFDLEPERASFDQTFGKWGMGPGPAIELPALSAVTGPTNGRGLLALPFDIVLGLQIPPYVPGLNHRALTREQTKQDREAADDYYVFRRDSYAARSRAMAAR